MVIVAIASFAVLTQGGSDGAEPAWGAPVPAGDVATLKAAISAAAVGDPTCIELTADVEFAVAGDTITVPAGKVILITSAVAAGAPFAIDAAALGRVVWVEAGGTLYLTDVTITRGSVAGTPGGGIYNEGVLALGGGATVTGNYTGDRGGGVYTSGTLTLGAGAEVSDNFATYGGGVAVGAAGTLAMDGGAVHSNSATYGGGVHNSGSFAMDGGVISLNNANYGGGVYSTGSFAMAGGEVSGHSSACGGGVYNTGVFDMQGAGAVLSGNTAREGGGLYNYGASALFRLSAGTISGNSASHTGGGIHNDDRAAIEMSGGAVSGNRAVDSLTMPPYTSGFGGGLCNWWGTVTMSGGSFTGNAARFGGGVFNYLGNVFSMSGAAAISGNSGMTGQYSSGGGVYNYGFFTMYDSAAISGNTAPWGGGVFNEYNTFTMEGGRVEGNSSTTGNGGGIYVNNSVDPNSNVAINGGVITGNTTVSNGGGIWIGGANLDKVLIAPGVVFSDNRAATAYSRSPADDATYNAKIGVAGAGVAWTDPFEQGYNNFDIGYIGIDRLAIVTFMRNHSVTDDAVVNVIAVAMNTAIGAQMPADPARAGYSFTGWNGARDGSGASYDGSGPVITGNTALYAQWEPLPPAPPPAKRHTVTYDGNGSTDGSAPVDRGTYANGATVTVLGQGGLAKAGHAFLGWSADRGAPSASYQEGDSFRIYSDTTLYAVWQPDGLYTVTFVDQGGEVLKTELVPHGGAAAAPPDPSYGGRTFLGWDKPFDNVTSDLTVYALYDGLAGSPPSRTGEWALLNLLMALAGVLAAVLSVAHAAREEGKRAGGRSEAPLPIGRSASWALLAGIAAVAGVVFFLVTEDMRLPMTLVDEWTVFSALVLAVTAMAAALSLLHRGAWRKVFRQGPLVAGGDRAEAGSPYPFTMRGGYAGAVSYRIGAGGEWRLAFPDGDGAYAIPGDEVTDDLYIEYHP